MRPVTFHLGDLPVHSFGLLVVLGAALGFVLVRADLRRSGLDRRLVAPLVLGVLLAAGVGARLLATLRDGGSSPDAARLLDGPLDSAGAIALGGAAAWFLARRLRLRPLAACDAFAAAAALGEAAARVGCHLAGDGHWGPPTDLPWGVRYLAAAGWEAGAPPVHPTPLYEALACLLVFVCVRRARHLGDGFATAAYLIGIAVARFTLAPFRTDPPVAGPLLPGHVAAAVALLVGLLVLRLATAGRAAVARPSAADLVPPGGLPHGP